MVQLRLFFIKNRLVAEFFDVRFFTAHQSAGPQRLLSNLPRVDEAIRKANNIANSHEFCHKFVVWDQTSERLGHFYFIGSKVVYAICYL